MFGLTPENIKEIDKLLNKERFTYSMLRTKFNLTDYQLRKVIKDNNISFTNKTPRYKLAVSSKEEINKEIERMFMENYPGTKIAESLNISVTTVYKAIKDMNLKRKPIRIKWTMRLTQALMFTCEKFGTKAAMERFGIKRHSVYQNKMIGKKYNLTPKDHFLPQFDNK